MSEREGRKSPMLTAETNGGLTLTMRVWRIGGSWVVTVPSVFVALMPIDEHGDRWIAIRHLEGEEGFAVRPVTKERP